MNQKICCDFFPLVLISKNKRKRKICPVCKENLNQMSDCENKICSWKVSLGQSRRQLI